MGSCFSINLNDVNDSYDDDFFIVNDNEMLFEQIVIKYGVKNNLIVPTDIAKFLLFNRKKVINSIFHYRKHLNKHQRIQERIKQEIMLMSCLYEND